MGITRWSIIVLMVAICVIIPSTKTALAKGSYPLTSNRISFVHSGPRIYGKGGFLPVRLDIVSPHKKIDHIILQSRGTGVHSNVYSSASVYVNRSGPLDSRLPNEGERIDVPNAQRVGGVGLLPLAYAACGKNSLSENAWVKGEGGRIGSPSNNELTFWKDCEPPRVQLQLKRMDGSVLGGSGHNQVYGSSVLLEVSASDDQGIKDIVVKDAGLTRVLGSRQYSHGLVRRSKFQVRIPVGAYSDQPVGLRVFVRDWTGSGDHPVEVSTGYTSGSVHMDRVTPTRVNPGQGIRVSGHFNTNAFNNHRFKLWLAPPLGGLGIDLLLRQVSETTIDASIPENLRAGTYTIFVKDTVSGNSTVGHVQIPLVIANGGIRAARSKSVNSKAASAIKGLASGRVKVMSPGLHAPVITSYSRTRVRPGNELHVNGARLGASNSGVIVSLQKGSSRIRVVGVRNWNRGGTGFDISVPAAPPGRYQLAITRSGKTTMGPDRLVVIR